MHVYLRETRNDQRLLGFTIQVSGESLSRGFFPVVAAMQLLRDIIDPATAKGRAVTIEVTGHLGNSLSLNTGPVATSTAEVRRVHRRWITQAVQADAALLPQLVACPF